MKKNKNNYKWLIPINAKAICDFERRFGIDEKRIQSNHYVVLTFIVEICLKKRRTDKLISETVYGKEYFYMSSSFILDNLPILKIQKRSMVRLLEDLEQHGYIERIVLEKNKRYIRITNALKEHYLGETEEFDENSHIEYLVDRTSRIFSLTLPSQKNQARLFISSLEDPKFYQEQLNGYAELKEYSNEYMHTFSRFKEIWDSQDWSNVLERRRHQDLVKRLGNQI